MHFNLQNDAVGWLAGGDSGEARVVALPTKWAQVDVILSSVQSVYFPVRSHCFV